MRNASSTHACILSWVPQSGINCNVAITLHWIATVWRLYDTLIYHFLTHTDNLFVPHKRNSRKTPDLGCFFLKKKILGHIRPAISGADKDPRCK